MEREGYKEEIDPPMSVEEARKQEMGLLVDAALRAMTGLGEQSGVQSDGGMHPELDD